MSDLTGMRNVTLYLSEGHIVRLLLTEEETRTLRDRYPHDDIFHPDTFDMDTQSGTRVKFALRRIVAIVDEDATRVAHRARLLFEMQEHAS